MIHSTEVADRVAMDLDIRHQRRDAGGMSIPDNREFRCIGNGFIDRLSDR